eukprot:6561681-Prorocentrum_lima.AAC.1
MSLRVSMVESARAVSSFVIVHILSDIHGRWCESTTFTYKSFQLSMVKRARAPRSCTRISMAE